MTPDRAQQDTPRSDDARVVPFRPRTSATAPGRDASEELNAADTSSDDFRHRMWVNIAGLACAALLTASGIWLASRISDLRQTQDCVLSGRRNCAPIAAVDGTSGPLRQH